MADYSNPWADAGNKAVNTLFQHYMMRPDPTQQMRSQLENKLLESQVGMNEINLNQMRNEQDVANKFREAFEQVPQINETGVPLNPGEMGPSQLVTQQDRNNDIARLFEQFTPTLGKDKIEAARDALGTAGALRFEDPIQRQLALDEKATSYNAFLPGGGSGGARAAKINDLMRLNNLPEKEAVNIVDGVYKYSTDNLTGTRTQFNPISNEMDILQPTNIPSTSEKVVDNVVTAPSDLSFDPGNATGIWPSIKNMSTRTAGQLFQPFSFQGPEQDAQKMRVLERDLIKALSSSSRPPVVEQQRITSMLSEPFEWFENPDTAREKVAGVVDLMMQQYRVDQGVADDVIMPAKERSDALRRMNEIKRTLSSVISPKHMMSLFSSGSGLTPEEEKEMRHLEALEGQ